MTGDRFEPALRRLLAALSQVHCNSGGYDKSVFRAAALALRDLPEGSFGQDLGQRMLDADEEISGALHELCEGLARKDDGFPSCWCRNHCHDWKTMG